MENCINLGWMALEEMNHWKWGGNRESHVKSLIGKAIIGVYLDVTGYLPINDWYLQSCHSVSSFVSGKPSLVFT